MKVKNGQLEDTPPASVVSKGSHVLAMLCAVLT